MQAVLLAAGQSSRFYPYGKNNHKSTITLLGLPLIVRTIQTLESQDIKDIVIITSNKNSLQKIIEKFQLHAKIVYIEQSIPKGMGDALLKAREVLQETFFLLHAHHVEAGVFIRQMQKMQLDTKEVVLLAKETDNLEKYGVIKLKGNVVTEITEKPKSSSSEKGLRVIGVYLLSRQFLPYLMKAGNSHYNFEEALGKYARTRLVKAVVTKEDVLTLKYPWDILRIKDYLLRTITRKISEGATIADSAVITGEVVIEKGVRIMEHVTIKGPAYIGANVSVGDNVIIRNGVTLEEGVAIGAHMEIKHSVFFEGTKTHAGYIGDSVIGKKCKLAGFFCTGNVRLDRKNIKVIVGENTVESGLRSLGVLMGESVLTGIRVCTMPGTIIGNNVIVGPSTTLFKNISDNKRVYAKFSEFVVEENNKKNIIIDEQDEKKKTVLFDIDYTLFDTANFKETNLQEYLLYEEVLTVLEKLSGFTTLGIFSEGEANFQQEKLLKTNIHGHFIKSNVYIVPDKEQAIESVVAANKKNKTFLVDDKLSVLRTVSKIDSEIVTIWIKRGPFAQSQEAFDDFTPDATVSNLENIVDIIANTD